MTVGILSHQIMSSFFWGGRLTNIWVLYLHAVLKPPASSPNLQLLEFPSCLIMHVIQRQQQDTCIAPISRYDMHLFLYAVNKDYADHWSVVHYAEN